MPTGVDGVAKMNLPHTTPKILLAIKLVRVPLFYHSSAISAINPTTAAAGLLCQFLDGCHGVFTW